MVPFEEKQTIPGPETPCHSFAAPFIRVDGRWVGVQVGRARQVGDLGEAFCWAGRPVAGLIGSGHVSHLVAEWT